MKSKHVLLRQYGTYTVGACFLGFIGYTINKKVFNPPEFQSKEEKKSKSTHVIPFVSVSISN